ncbi:hypothetical protein SUGI_0491200 [Cryptomeria japonica]|nr:hypothetical protein SUGI_0491200 [Cryptomeria japonica]
MRKTTPCFPKQAVFFFQTAQNEGLEGFHFVQRLCRKARADVLVSIGELLRFSRKSEFKELENRIYRY